MQQEVINQENYSHFVNQCYPTEYCTPEKQRYASEKSTESESEFECENVTQNYTYVESLSYVDTEAHFQSNPQNAKYKIQLCRNFFTT